MDPRIQIHTKMSWIPNTTHHEGRMVKLIDDLLPVERGLQLVHRLDEEIHVPGLLPLVSLGHEWQDKLL
jgi:hypothetical protein